jgi:hypothetical protein
MSKPKDLAALRPILAAVQQLIDRFDKKGVVIGGAAICLLSQPRMTADVDAMLLVSIEDVPRLLRVAREIGFTPRIKAVERFARKNRIVLLRHRATDTDVDISLGALPFEIESVKRSHIARSGNVRVRVPTVEDLIIMKAVAHRPKDLVDIQILVGVNPNLDRERIRNWVQEFAQALVMPELWDDIVPLIENSPS